MVNDVFILRGAGEHYQELEGTLDATHFRRWYKEWHPRRLSVEV